MALQDIKKIMNIAFPFTMLRRNNRILKNINIVISSIISIWFYGTLLIVAYMLISYEKTEYKKLAFYYSKASSTIDKSYLHIESKKQYDFLLNDPLNQEIPTTKIIYVDNKLFFSWLLGPVFISNLVTKAETRAITPIGLDIIFLNYGLKRNSKKLVKDLDLSHELVHILQHEKYGYFTSRLHTPSWVSEGYATYRMAEYGTKRIDSLKISNFYANAGNLVRYSINTQDISLDKLHLGNVSYNELLSFFCIKYKKYWGCK